MLPGQLFDDDPSSFRCGVLFHGRIEKTGAAEFEKELGRASAICIDIADKIVRETLK